MALPILYGKVQQVTQALQSTAHPSSGMKTRIIQLVVRLVNYACCPVIESYQVAIKNSEIEGEQANLQGAGPFPRLLGAVAVC